MAGEKYKYVYGPVFSWRLGRSLGIDPLSQRDKVCSFDCVYCQIGRTKILTKKREVFVSAKKIIEEINSIPNLNVDYVTFSGRGEPTLAKNLGKMIRLVKKTRKEKVAVITNASLLWDKDVRKDLYGADFVIAKLDASSERVFKRVNCPAEGLEFAKVLGGIKNFLSEYRGKLALQIMFIKENEKHAKEIARLARNIGAAEVEINTPLRPCAVKPLTRSKIKKIEKYFKGQNVKSVYKSRKRKVKPISSKETLRRRGKI